MEREESWSSVSWSPVQEAGTVYQACQGTGLAQKVLECCKDFQHNWRAVRTLDTGGCSGFWRFQSYVYGNVRQCSAWRGLHRVCTLSHSSQ